ncbi:hypothetical protein [Patulibacter minatonensis]|uniref:hypothetical protein n=1 Tax=Patulibacter minatonensis TaxID=298163 RepID=UPI000479521D|nr:hypothetical protein [Patulibacter minatonensis]
MTTRPVPPAATTLALPVAAALALGVTGCGSGATASPAGSSPPATNAAARSTAAAPASRTQSADAVARIVAGHYDAETNGHAVHKQLRNVIHDPGLVAALAADDLPAARAAAARLTVGKAHISRLQVRRGGRKVVDVGVPFCVAGPSATIRAADGRSLGVATVSIQDEIGVVRLLHRHNPAHVFIKGASGTARTSLQPARHVRLPTRGTVAIQGRRYAVTSFRRWALDHERVRIFILAQR